MNPYSGKMQTIDKATGERFNPGKMFNAKDELNAGSKAEALERIASIVNGMADGDFQIERKASLDVSAEESDRIIKEAFADTSSEGFRMVGQGLLNPIKEVIDYEGLARKVWAPRTVKAGEVVRYDKDPFVRAWQIGEDGETPESKVEGTYIYPSEFEITAYPTIEIKDKFRAQFDILARIQDRARQSIEYREDIACVNLLLAGGAAVNTTTFFPVMNLAAFEAMRYQIERHRLICDKFIIHRHEVSDLVTTVSGQVDPVTQRELIMAGFIGSILNSMIITTAGTNTFEILQPGQALAVTDPEHLGGMPIRVELMSEPVNQSVMGKPVQGWFFYELLSMVLVNPAGVSLGSLI